MLDKVMLFSLVAVLAGGVQEAGAQSFCPEVAIVLALDASGSISAEEYQLQVHGSASALMESELLDLIASQGGISISALVWSDASSGVLIVPWHRVEGEATMAAFAQQIVSAPRIPSGNTDIGAGLWQALDLLTQPGGCASRQLINISGDGRETAQARGRARITIAVARERARNDGVIINGLAIRNEDADLAAYFEKNIMTGPGSFVMEIGEYADFETAMTKKLVREISTPLIGQTEDGQSVQAEFSALSAPSSEHGAN